ncbi:methyltransferase domain-containing protein [Xanthomonadaceae bacterium JHOS43]|nr:methyltransferase domain-containing protein [Xanthomonadaceae bacterium JHOS43]MCX7563917.1 methyltransferase domain-containing protein [Xanthomonadaceae bacterium XH05]
MPAASPPRQPDRPLAWFDTPQGRAVLADEHGLLMPLLVRCPGSRVCHVLPTANAAAHAPPMLMPNSDRLWCDAEGWHAGEEPARDIPGVPAHSVDLVVAMHVVGTLPEPLPRLAAIQRMLAPGGTVFFVEFNPWGPYRRQWRDLGMDAMPLRRLRALVDGCGLEVGASYALRPRTSSDSSGMLLRHNWRLPAWLPFRAYVIRARKPEPGMTLAGGKALSSALIQAPNA